VALPELQTSPVAAVSAPCAVNAFAAARSGDRAAFVRLIRLHQGLAFSVALRICGNRADAEELAQDAFLQLHRNLGVLDDVQHLKHWLIRTVSHRSIDRLRQGAREPSAGAEQVPEAVAAPPSDGDPLLSRALARLLARLPGPARAVVVLRYQEDLDPTEIAATLDMSLNTVKSHLRRSLEWLRTQAPELHHEP
jgi:RNA polymerase sigma-70 factor, ECF subfamily